LEWRTPPRVTRIGQVDKDIKSSNLNINDKSADGPSKTIDIIPDVSS
jgi:hypothetical protein